MHFISISVNKYHVRHKHALHSILGSFMIRYPKIQTHSMRQHKFWKNKKKNCIRINSNCFPFCLSMISWNISYKKWVNNKTFFGQISGLNKEIKFCLLSCLLKHHIILHAWNCSNLSSFPSLFHHKPCFLFHGELS